MTFERRWLFKDGRWHLTARTYHSPTMAIWCLISLVTPQFGTPHYFFFLRKGCCFDYVISLGRSPYAHCLLSPHLTFCCSSRLLLRAGEVPMEEVKVSLHLNVIQHATSGKGALLHSLRCWNLGWNFTTGWWNFLREFPGIEEVGLKLSSICNLQGSFKPGLSEPACMTIGDLKSKIPLTSMKA